MKKMMLLKLMAVLMLTDVACAKETDEDQKDFADFSDDVG